MNNKSLKIVFLTPALYMAGGVERVLTLKANYFADHFGYDVTIVLTDGKDKPLFYPLSEKIKVVNLDINFEELWTCSFIKKIWIYLKKQRTYRRLLTAELMRLRPDITVSLMRREVNFINDIKDGSRKVGELHVNRAHYRNFESANSNWLKHWFSKFWMRRLLDDVRRLDRLVVLTAKDREAWAELDHVVDIPNPLTFEPQTVSQLSEKRVIAVGRYCYEKGYDLLLQAWAKVAAQHPDWRLDVFGDGDRTPYEQQRAALGLSEDSCRLHGRTSDIEKEYLASSLLVCSSRFEGFGMMLVEAMACGLPVVSFDCQWGPRSIIADGQDGLLVADGNVDKLAEGLSRLMTDASLRQQMGQAARENVKRFRIDAIAARWQALFNEVCNSEKN